MWIQSKIRRFYPKTTPTMNIKPLDEKTKKYIVGEVQSGKFGIPIENYLASCQNVATFTFPSHVTLHIVAPESEKPPCALIARTLRRIVCVMRMFQSSKHLTFWVLPTLMMREFPSNGEIVRPYHINGGFTYPSLNTVFIYRFEEFPKVLLHETIHHMPMDVHGQWPYESIMKMYHELHISKQGCNTNQCTTDIMPNEAIVETWAELLHIGFLNYEYPSMNFNTLLKTEQTWAAQQTRRLWTYQQMYLPEWKEDTRAYSYIVLRAALLWNWQAFIKIPFPYSPTKMTDFILASVKNPAFLEAVRKSRVSITNTFRMTAFGNL